MIGTYVFIILEKSLKSLTHVWKTGMYAHTDSEFVLCCKPIKQLQSVGCNHNHNYRKLQSASMLSSGNFYFIQPFSSHLFLVHLILSLLFLKNVICTLTP